MPMQVHSSQPLTNVLSETLERFAVGKHQNGVLHLL